MGGALQKVFNPTIAGTGQTARDLENIGYSPQDLATLDPKRGIADSMLKGAAGGFGQGQPQGQQSGNPILQPGSGPAPVDPSYFAPTQFRSQRSPLYG